MKTICQIIVSAALTGTLLAGPALADPDWYKGDTVIYTGASMNLKPNVLFVIDNNSTMNNAAAGVSYDPAITYAGSNETWSVYKLTGQANYVQHITANNQTDFETQVACADAETALKEYGTYSGGANSGLKSNGTCGNGGAGVVYLGNLLNYNEQGASGAVTLSGSVSVTFGSNIVTGTGTNFSTDLANGNNITINGVGYTVASIAGNTSLTLTGNYSGVGTTLNGTISVTNGIADVTGTGTQFLTQATVGTLVVIGGMSYTVAGVSSNTAMTLAAPYTGATNAAAFASLAVSTGLQVHKVTDLTTQITLVRNAVEAVVGGSLNAMKFGMMTFNSNNKGGRIVYGVDVLDTATKFNNFKSLLNGNTVSGVTGITLLSGETRPLAESLYDAGAYFKGSPRPLPISGSAAPASPIEGDCQMNHVIYITNGDTIGDNDPTLKTMKILATDSNGDVDHDGAESGGYGKGSHFYDDAAKFLYETRFSQSDPFPFGEKGWGWMTTHSVLVFSPHKDLMALASDGPFGTHGRGAYLQASNAASLTSALIQILSNIVQPKNSSFVAPVVPVSPENRTYSGSRVYMGFFKPQSNQQWYGNLKKYGLDGHNSIMDKNGLYASYVDLDGNNLDDRDGANLATVGAVNGSFRPTSVSYWTNNIDVSEVTSGGAGEVLRTRATARDIYTYTGTNVDLMDASNAFSTANGAISALLGDLSTLPSPGSATPAEALVNFIHGFDAYDFDSDANRTEKREWLMGDILHSKPLVVNYASFTAANEGNCSINKTMIYVGSNDGLLHAFRDCDGKEAWAFLPPDLLQNLRQLPLQNHTYFVDSSVSVYTYDANHDGTIATSATVPAGNDKVILIIGQRRGGGVMNASPTTGSYYALDVSNPGAPTYLWRISNTASPHDGANGYQGLGETWSEPKIISKMKYAVNDKRVVMFIGGGYDNCNEDGRYGATQTFSNSCVAGVITDDSGLDGAGLPKTSAGATLSSGLTNNPRGSAIYAVEIAKLDADGAPSSFAESGKKLWSYVDPTQLNFSIPGEVAAIDKDFDGYVDTLYAGDTGGNMWAFDVDTPGTWGARKIFNSNPGSDKGRKIFYKPSVTIEVDSVMVFFGTGDREHPLNRAVTDRMYGLYDRGQATPKNEDDLVNVTSNQLQTSADAAEIAGILEDLADDENYGWYIKLDGTDRLPSVNYVGEKVLASPVVFNKVAYFTTYAPSTEVVADPCADPAIGTGRIYAVDYKTGEAVINYDATNDNTTTTNERAKAIPGQVLVRSDRVMTLGEGIPSGIVLVVSPSGELSALIGTGGKITTAPTKKGGTLLPVYWRQR